MGCFYCWFCSGGKIEFETDNISGDKEKKNTI